MEWDIKNIDSIVNYINSELANNRTMVSIEQDIFGVNERVIHKRLLRIGYKKINNKYRPQESVTSKVTTSNAIDNRISNITSNRLDNRLTIAQEVENTGAISKEIKDIDKLNLLLENIDSLLKLIPKDITGNSSLRSGINDVKSFRVDTGIYKAIKERATRDNITIADILNKSLEDYLNNYL